MLAFLPELSIPSPRPPTQGTPYYGRLTCNTTTRNLKPVAHPPARPPVDAAKLTAAVFRLHPARACFPLGVCLFSHNMT